jgi:hypothetical protein
LAEKLSPVALSASLKKQTKPPARQFRYIIPLFQPETLFGWHRQLFKAKLTHARKNKVGRPPKAGEVKRRVMQLPLENNWGNGQISGEMEKLGITSANQLMATS